MTVREYLKERDLLLVLKVVFSCIPRSLISFERIKEVLDKDISCYKQGEQK